MICIRLFIPLAAVLIVGCATDIPVPRGNTPSGQTKLRATHHWDLVAADIAAQMQKRLLAVGPVAAVHLRPPVNRSPFELAMHDFVITHLVANGVPVDANPGGALQLTLHTQLVTNVSERDMKVKIPLTAIATGIVVAHGISFPDPELVSAVAIAGAAAFDIGTGHLTRPGAPSKTELVVTTSMMNGGRFLMRKSDVYYIEDADLSLFTEPRSPIPTPVREYRVQGER